MSTFDQTTSNQSSNIDDTTLSLLMGFMNVSFEFPTGSVHHTTPTESCNMSEED